MSSSLGDRYGAPAPWRRRTLLLGIVVLVGAFLGWLAWTTYEHADPEVSSSLVSFHIESPHAASATVEVQLRDPSVRARCLVQAVAKDHTVVGELSFRPRPTKDQTYDERLRTERRATSVEMVGCTAPGQPRPN